MKKFILLFIGVIAMPSLFAQGFYDALRYSTDEIQGTARFRGMSGAFGALGGDMSAVSLNPAGSAVFTRGHTSLSVLSASADRDVSYSNGMNASSNDNFDLNQAGVVFVFQNTSSNSGWRKFVLGLSYEQTANYDDDYFASGVNTQSIGSYFLANAQGLRLDEISAFPGESIANAYNDIGSIYGFSHQQAFLGYESYILEPDMDDDANTFYTSNIAPGNFNHEFSYAATGYNGKFTVNGALQYEDNIYIGVNLNSHFINYNRSTYLFEENSNPGSSVWEVGFENNLFTEGSGFSFQLGGIAKLSDSFRVGLTYDSPVWLEINEESTQYLATIRDDGGSDVTTELDPNVINIYDKYKLQTPSKITGSAAVIFEDRGLISLDYSRKDYSSAKFKPTDDAHFASQNNLISDVLKSSNSYRIGGELREKQMSFRAGYRFEESPFDNTSLYGDLTGYSLGIGYNFGGTKLDLAYERSERQTNHQLFDVGLTDSVILDQENSNLTLTLSLTL